MRVSSPYRLTRTLALGLSLALLAATAPAADKPLGADDLAWLKRDGFGIDSAALTRYQQLGRSRFLDQQLTDTGEDALPPAIAAQLQSFEALNTPPAQLLLRYRDQQQQVKAMPDGDAKVAAKKQVRKHERMLEGQAQQAVLLHAIYGPNQLKEQLVWFWLNHFSIYGTKGRVKLVAADYAEHVIRPHAFGTFEDLVMATLQSPAMLEFLDNDKNAKGQVNENYARELMELHTLGVGSGYTQTDVQQLALILTGVGIAPPRFADGPLPRRFAQAGVVREGLFLFNPNRHDFSDKTFLGHRIKGTGFDEVKQALDLIVHQPACATFVSRKLATYFIGDDPSPELVASMAKTFQRTDGNIAQVLRTMFTADAASDPKQPKFKDPTRFVVSAMRLAYDGRPIANARPLTQWLRQMGEPVYGRITPDGWSLASSSWTGSGQIAKRFDIAAMIGSGRNRLFVADDPTVDDPADTASTAAKPTPLPIPRGTPPDIQNSAVYRSVFAPTLAPATREALTKAKNPAEWNTFLLASPDFNNR